MNGKPEKENISPWVSFETPKVEGPEKRKMIKGVVFQLSEKYVGDIRYISSDPSGKRKIIILGIENEAIPEEGVSYDVELLKDTNQYDPRKGALIVRIIGKSETPKEREPETEEGAPETEEGAPLEIKPKRETPEFFRPIEVDEKTGRVLILETELPLAKEKGALTPNPERFRHFTLDRQTLAILEKAATAVELKEPCLLEGETSTSKTSSIEYLAMTTGHEAVRMNLNGQTDTSELIGKFVPNDGRLQVEFENLLSNSELLSEGSQQILQKANSEGRGLTLLESQKIAKNEGLKVPDWHWQDGIVPDAMKKGRWVILDEINLAEPQILERLNSVLEKYPSLTLSENGGIKIGEGGEFNVGPNFRIFATMNPAEYTGRAPMSPAYKDRWLSYLFVQPPEEEAYRAMLCLMVYGEQPLIEMRGKKFQMPKAEPMLETLQKIPNFRGFLPKLAKFQVTIESLARRREIGKNKKERYIFTRRGLIEFLEYLERKTIVERKTGAKVSVLDNPKEVILRALQYYYLDKISDPDDLKKVQDQLDAIGISSQKWIHKFEKEKITKIKGGAEKDWKEAEREVTGEKLEGHDPEEFLYRVISTIISRPEDVEEAKRQWVWIMSKDGKFVDMSKRQVPDNFVDKQTDIHRSDVDIGGESNISIKKLLEVLAGKRVVSLRNKDGWWILEVVEGEKKERPREFLGISGNMIEVSGKDELEGYRVGDRVRVKPEFLDKVIPEVKSAKNLQIVGFTQDRQDRRVVVQIDGYRCGADFLPIFRNFYEKIEEPPPEKEKSFTVTLQSFPIANKINVVKTLREVLGLDLHSAKTFADNVPASWDQLDSVKAEVLQSELEDLGAKVKVLEEEMVHVDFKLPPDFDLSSSKGAALAKLLKETYSFTVSEAIKILTSAKEQKIMFLPRLPKEKSIEFGVEAEICGAKVELNFAD